MLSSEIKTLLLNKTLFLKNLNFLIIKLFPIKIKIFKNLEYSYFHNLKNKNFFKKYLFYFILLEFISGYKPSLNLILKNLDKKKKKKKLNLTLFNSFFSFNLFLNVLHLFKFLNFFSQIFFLNISWKIRLLKNKIFFGIKNYQIFQNLFLLSFFKKINFNFTKISSFIYIIFFFKNEKASFNFFNYLINKLQNETK